MDKITDIKVQQKNKDRANVYINGEFVCGLQLETIMQHHLKIGDEIPKNQLQTIQFDSEKSTAFTKCAKLLNGRLKTEKELKDYLLQKGYTTQVVDYCVDKLKEYKYLDDACYIDAFVRHNQEKYGKNVIKQKLIIKGISKSIIDNYFEQFDSSQDDIQALFTKFMKNKEDTIDNRNRAIKRLLSRGFSFDEIKQAISVSED